MREALIRVLGSERALMAGIFALTVAHSLPHLTTNPPLSYDEGYIVQAPWNLVERGFYGTADQAGSWLFDPHLTTGPTVTLPAAAVFALAGTGMLQARVVAVVYAGLAAVAFYALLRLAGGRFVATLGALLFSLSLYPYNRVLLGEVAGLFWVFVGARIWLVRPPTAEARVPLALAGVALGLAALSKLALAPIALGALAGHWLLMRFTSLPRPPLVGLLLPIGAALVPLSLWYGFQVAVLGVEGVLDRFMVMGDYREQMVDLSPDRLARNAAVAADALPPGLRLWAVPAALLAAVRLTQGAARSAVASFLFLLTLLGAVYYLLSIGWPRYGFWAAVGISGLAALLVHPFLGEIDRAAGLVRTRVQRGLVLGAFVALPAFWTGGLLGPPEDHAGTVVRFVEERTGRTGARLGTAEWELDFVAGRRFSHPPTYVATVAPATKAMTLDRTWQEVDWVVVGPIGRIFGAGERLRASFAFTEVFRSGPYVVFQRQLGDRPGWSWDTAGATRTPPLTQAAGQVFRAEGCVLDEVRVLLAGDGVSNHASVFLRLFESPEAETPLAIRELPGSAILENRWYSFPLDQVEVKSGRLYYFELVSFPVPGQEVPTAWYTSSHDLYPPGDWHLGNTRMDGVLYFGVVAHNR